MLSTSTIVPQLGASNVVVVAPGTVVVVVVGASDVGVAVVVGAAVVVVVVGESLPASLAHAARSNAIPRMGATRGARRIGTPVRRLRR